METDCFHMDIAEVRDRLPESVLLAYDHYRHYVEGYRWGAVRVLARYVGEDRVLVVSVRATQGGFLRSLMSLGPPWSAGVGFELTWCVGMVNSAPGASRLSTTIKDRERCSSLLALPV